jgi:hypothetical protein
MEGISTELRELLAIGAKSLTAAQAKDVAKDEIEVVSRGGCGIG